MIIIDKNVPKKVAGKVIEKTTTNRDILSCLKPVLNRVALTRLMLRAIIYVYWGVV